MTARDRDALACPTCGGFMEPASTGFPVLDCTCAVRRCHGRASSRCEPQIDGAPWLASTDDYPTDDEDPYA